MAIFFDIVQNKGNIVRNEFLRLLALGWRNQSHLGDLLLFHVNGFYNKKLVPYNENLKTQFNPHVIGPGAEGHSEDAHYKFIHKYKVSNTSKITYAEYLKMVKWDPKKAKEIDSLIEDEQKEIQSEMSIYLKFWESDMFIKKLYQFVRILHGESYDWYFKISESSRDCESSGTKQEIIRLKIRDRLKDISPILYDLIKSTYITQIRNSISHANYSFQGRNIHLNNFISEDPASQLRVVTFDEWIDIFHNTICLQNEYIRLNNAISDTYGEMSIPHNNIVPIQITEKDGKNYELPLKYTPEFKKWGY